MSSLRIGTCSWKYDSWRGLVYSAAPVINYLAEYARHYDCVEVDQWFWSLFPGNKVVFPKPKTVAEYAESVPDSFRFGVKMPNCLTLTHFHQESKVDDLIPNPHFLSIDLLKQFMDRTASLHNRFGPLMFQFEYLNRKKMPAQVEFQERLGQFVSELPKGFDWCVEIRNPNYLNKEYFEFLRQQALHPVFLQGYYMPSIFEIQAKFKALLGDEMVVRLHGPDREGIEDKSQNKWDKIIAPKDSDIEALGVLILDSQKLAHRLWVFANNHYEGSAPLTIERIKKAVHAA